MAIEIDEPPPTANTGDSALEVDADRAAYDRVFWLGYLANGLVTICNAMMVRYADFVNVLGGEERQLGLIVGCGMAGSILMRLAQGVCIDHYGASRVWVFSMIAYGLSLAAHLGLSTAYSWEIFLVRTLMQASLAGVFGASITFVSLRVPPQRMAEIVGTLGTSGFIGIMVGPAIGDWLCSRGPAQRTNLQHLFLLTVAITVFGTVATWLATRGEIRAAPRRQPRLSSLLRRYTPWSTALVATAMGAGFSIPFTFLRPFAVEMRIENVGFYFGVYAISAFITRLSTRHLFERYGNRPWIMAGMLMLTASYLLYLPARTLWQLAIPGAVAGVAHALLFPAVMAAGTSAFPRRYMGVATSLMLAMFDFGSFIGAPVVGAFLREGKRQSIAAYPWMFAGTALVFAVVAAVFWFSSRERESKPEK
jgi:MFS family permease